MSETPIVGSCIGKYRLTRELGRGGMGIVYEGLHDEIGRRAAIKVLSPHCADDPRYVDRFLNEARTISRVRHPGLVQIYDFGQTSSGAPYILMELLDGETLRSRLARRAIDGAPLAVAEARRVMRQIAAALAATHDEGIVHLDLKPDNVMLVADEEAPGGERVKLLDFGIARFVGSRDAALTASGTALGTAAYMSPEQCAGDAEIGAAADVYALGVMLHELLAGSPPFEGPTGSEVMRRHLVAEPPPLPATSPPHLARLVARMLAKEPTLRPSMCDVVEALAKSRGGLTVPGRRRSRDLTGDGEVDREALPCPYPGMRPYSADDADNFHGRGAEIDELLGRLRAGEREIYVIGPSGSGKSSLVAAGALPRLGYRGAGLGPFVVRWMRPGERPTARLGEVLEATETELTRPANAVTALLADRAPDVSLLIVIDQLEELFTLAGAGEREQLLITLRVLRTEPRCVVVFTLRADFFGAFMESALWTDRRGPISRIEVGPLRGDALREVIVRPARDLGMVVEPELVERLLADAASEPGILPLLQETMVQLWDRRQDRTLALADYQQLGDRDRSGLAVALARRADATLRALPPTQEAIARRILLRLVSFSEGRADTRRQQPYSKLRAAGDDTADFEHVLQRLIANRLLTSDEDDGDEARVDLAHEIMITAWPMLTSWIQDHRADEQRRRQLEAAAARWVEHGRGTRGLLDAIELAEAEAWQQAESARELGQSADVTALIAASRAALDRQARRRRGLVWSAFAALTVFGVVVATLAIAARHQASEAEASRKRAEADRMQAEARGRENKRLLAQFYQETGRQLLVSNYRQEAVPYLLAARQHGEGEASLRMMFWTATRSLPLTLPLQHESEVVSAAFSADGRRIVTASEDRTARVWDTTTGEPLGAPLEHQGWVRSAAFSPDGSRIVTASADRTARIWDAATGRSLGPPLEHRGPLRSAAFDPDGHRVVTASDDGAARIWDAATGEALARPLEHRGPVRSAAFSPDGRRVVTASEDGTARIWNAATGELLATPLGHRGPVRSAAFSPHGSRVVTASEDGTARVWDAATGKLLATPIEHQGTVLTAAFSPDGGRVVTASEDKTARIWDATTGKPLTAPLVRPATVLSAAFSPDGRRVITASADHIARIWDAATGEPLIARLEHQGPVWSAAFSPDGRRVATASVDNTACIWNVATGESLATPLEHQGGVWSATFSADGTRVATTSDDRTVRIWDAARGELLATMQHRGPVWNAAFSPDGTRVVTASDDRTARIWSAATGKLLATLPEHDGMVWSAAFSPDGRHVVTASADRTARVRDAATGEPLGAPLEHQATVWSAVFSPDGRRIVTASSDQTARIWDAVTGKPLATPLKHQGWVRSAAFSADGTRVVTASVDRTARIWDAATGEPLATLLEHQGTVRNAAFSPDGTRVVTASSDRTARVWDAVTGRPLTAPFWHEGTVSSAVFSPDGNRILTASADKTARFWETRTDEGTLAEWSALAERSPFVLSGGVHVRRPPRAPRTGSTDRPSVVSARTGWPDP